MLTNLGTSKYILSYLRSLSVNGGLLVLLVIIFHYLENFSVHATANHLKRYRWYIISAAIFLGFYRFIVFKLSLGPRIFESFDIIIFVAIAFGISKENYLSW